ncbi:acetyltransferase [Sphingomonas sp. Leaf339]|uniref:GNAT family N-acetyltransferase n=1 Tax=Sphingomonas sp. Leaf339 TaxID=1736343 RepID=UPI0006F2AD93|nr:GNAT family N-acetyltransferase [Sphingomonas sp. Leaf339]KQU53129.1 acetyltransferase [Sphingomonas sp. Leaf339]
MTDVRDNPTESRFELTIDGTTAIAAYTREGDTLVFTHTAVPDALAGQGVATRLIAGALEQVRARGERIVPACSFVAHYVAEHPETRDLIA